MYNKSIEIAVADLGSEIEWCTHYKTHKKIDELKGQLVKFPQNCVVHVHYSHTPESATAYKLCVFNEI